MDEIAALLSLQDGVISRRQALAAGLRPHSIERLLRRREWATIHPGGYVDHTGPPSAATRARVVGPMLRDVVYRGPRGSWTQIVELDGRLR